MNVFIWTITLEDQRGEDAIILQGAARSLYGAADVMSAAIVDPEHGNLDVSQNAVRAALVESYHKDGRARFAEDFFVASIDEVELTI